MPRGLDHIVHAVRDLDAAAELYRQARLHRRRAQPAFLGHAQSAGPAAGFLRGAADRRGAGKARQRRLLGHVRPLQPVVPRASGGLVDAAPGKRRRGSRCRGVPVRRNRRLRGAEVRARGQAAGRLDGQGRVLAGLCPRRQGAGHRLRDLPAAFSRKLLESGLSAAPQYGERHRGGRAGRGQSDRPSHLPVGFHRRARFARHLERRHRIDAARRHQGDGPGGLPQSFRHRAAGHLRWRKARRPAISRPRPRRADGGVELPAGSRLPFCMGSTIVAPETAMGATLVFA